MTISPPTADLVHAWTRRNGGFGGRPKAHTLRLLREVVELTVATGASREEVSCAVNSELNKAEDKHEFITADEQISWDAIRSEVADVSVLIEVFCYHFREKINQDDCVRSKLPVLEQRKWTFDQDGVLWRP